MKQAKVQEYVEKMLRQQPETRNLNANELYKLFIQQHYPNLPFEEVYDKYELYGMPPIESVPRARRSLVEKYPELKGSEEVEEARQEKEIEMHMFYGRKSFFEKNNNHIPRID